MADVKPGDWVRVWAQVLPGDIHPEDIFVRLESHNEHYQGPVRLDRIEAAEAPPSFAGTCTRLRKAATEGMLTRCERHEGHGGDHRRNRLTWTEAETYGYVEEK